MSPDPIGYLAGDTNYCRYVGNNPALYINPAGRGKLLAGVCCPVRARSSQLKLKRYFNTAQDFPVKYAKI